MLPINFNIITLTCLGLLLSACGSIEVHDPLLDTSPKEEITDTSDSLTDPLTPYEQLMVSARTASTKNNAAIYYYEAAKLSAIDGDYSKALNLLHFNVLPYEHTKLFDAYLLTSEINIERRKYFDTLSDLSKAKRFEQANQAKNSNRISQLRAETLEYLQTWPAAVKERIKLSLSLPIEEQSDNQDRLWNSVQNLSDSDLKYLQNNNDPILNGWLEISSFLRNTQDTVSQQLEKFSQWQRKSPFHPAAAKPPIDFEILAKMDDFTPQRITLMLPMTGNLAKASKAITDGFMASHFAQTNNQANINVVNTDKFENVQDAYNKALEFNPEIIIGPLQKELVAQLNFIELPVPVIALNKIEFQSLKPNLYHFSLDSEDEINQLIIFSQLEDANRAAILSIQDTWALRQADEFKRLSETANVEIIEQLDYENTPQSRQNAVRSLLLIDESKKREQWISKSLNTDVETIERSRKDLDYVFFVGRFADAKQIRPLLDFYFASDVPMLATNTINNANLNKLTKDEDIERIYFTEIPLLTNNNLSSDAISNNDPNIIKRLKALGGDAFLLANRYPIFQQIPNAKIPGYTGILSMDNTQIFRKRPELVTYKKGKLIHAKENGALTYREKP